MSLQKKKKTAKKSPKKIGRPTVFSQQLCDKICELIATSSKGLPRICATNKGLPTALTIQRWLREEGKGKDAFRKQYARAREAQADFLADEIIKIADNNKRDAEPFVGANHIQRDKLRTDARKWAASKLAPKKYGDKIDLTTDGEKITGTQSVTNIRVVLPKEDD